MAFRIVILAAILIGMSVFLYNKCSEEEEGSASIKSSSGATQAGSAAAKPKESPRRPNSAGETGTGYKFEYQDENGRWHPVREFSQIPSQYRGHSRPIAAPSSSNATAAQNPEQRPAPAAVPPTGGSAPKQPGSAAPKQKNENSGPSEAEKELSEVQSKQAAQEAMYKEWAAKCKSLSDSLDAALKAWNEVKDSIPPCQLKEDDCYDKYDDYKAKLQKDIENLTRGYNDCREGARKAGVPPGYLR